MLPDRRVVFFLIALFAMACGGGASRENQTPSAEGADRPRRTARRGNDAGGEAGNEAEAEESHRAQAGRHTGVRTAEQREEARRKTAEANSLWQGPSPVRFVEEREQRGIDFEQFNGKSPQRYYVEIVGSGSIFFDAEGDGDTDLYLLNQTNVDGAAPSPAAHSALFLNDGTGHFTAASEETGLFDRHYSAGVCGGDIDNDGDMDLYVTRFNSPNALFRNDGNLKFTDISATAGAPGDIYTPASCSFADIDNDGFLDLYVATYVKANHEINPPCMKKLKATGEKVREYCGPGKYAAVPDHLYRNKGNGTFEDVSQSNGIAAAKGNSLGVGFADWDQDGDQDLYVACDRTSSLLYENDGHGRFTESAMKYGIGLSPDGTAEAGMGMNWGDYDGDGWLDLVKTNYEYENNNLFRNLKGKGFLDVKDTTGIGPPSYSYLGWGTALIDAENDGDLDLFVVNGHLRRDIGEYEEMSGGILEGYEQLNLFFLQKEPGKFISMGAAAGPGLEVRKVSRGIAWADVDRDGDIDVMVTNQHEHPDLLINESPNPGHWLRVNVRGTKSNRDGIGARVEIEAGGVHQVRQIATGGAYLSQSELTAHFGLGGTKRVTTLTIHWPSGATDVLRDLAADRSILVVEGKGISE